MGTCDHKKVSGMRQFFAAVAVSAYVAVVCLAQVSPSVSPSSGTQHCRRCYPGSSGPCQNVFDVCWQFDSGSGASGVCPAGANACSCPLCNDASTQPCHYPDGSCSGYASGTVLCPEGSFECYTDAGNAPSTSTSLSATISTSASITSTQSLTTTASITATTSATRSSTVSGSYTASASGSVTDSPSFGYTTSSTQSPSMSGVPAAAAKSILDASPLGHVGTLALLCAGAVVAVAFLFVGTLSLLRRRTQTQPEAVRMATPASKHKRGETPRKTGKGSSHVAPANSPRPGTGMCVCVCVCVCVRVCVCVCM